MSDRPPAFPPPLSKNSFSRIRKLKSRKGRDEQKRILIEGPRVVSEALCSGLVCHHLLFPEEPTGENLLHRLVGSNQDLQALARTLPKKLFQSLCDTDSPQGVLGEFTLPESPPWSVPDEGNGIVMVLHEVREPGNVGAAIRSAAGFGVRGIILSKGSADVWNPKTVRAAAGAVFKAPVWQGLSCEAIKDLLARGGFVVWLADVNGKNLFEMGKAPSRLAIVFGNETRGVETFVGERDNFPRIGLPMSSGVESLNVGASVAAFLAILKSKSN